MVFNPSKQRYNMKKQYSTIDITRFFFAICIVALHSYAFENLPKPIFFCIHKGIFRLAVPYFFVASGFFFMRGCLSDGEEYYKHVYTRMVKYCKRVLFPFVIFAIVNATQKLITISVNGRFSSSTVINVLKHILFLPYGPVWFLSACAVGILILSVFIKRNSINLALLTGGGLYIFALLCNNYYFLIQGTIIQPIVDVYTTLFISPRNGIFTGFFFLALGTKCSMLVDKWENKRLFTALVFSYFLYLIECVTVQIVGIPKDDGSLYIMHIVVVPILLLLTAQYSVDVDENLAKKLRNYSMGIYLLHAPILWFLWLFSENGFINFIITIVISITMCTISYRSKNKLINQLLR